MNRAGEVTNDNSSIRSILIYFKVRGVYLGASY